MRLKNKIGIVTAAGSGMGRAGAIRFAQEGASVAVVDVDGKSVDAVVKAITAAGGKAIGIAADLREDANAIRTAWQRSEFLPEADRSEAAALLLRYLDVRLEYAGGGRLAPDRTRAFLSETRSLQDRLWSMAVANARLDMNSDVAALYVESLNELSEVHASRVAVGIQARIPGEVWLVLSSIIALGMLSVGYQTGIAGSKRSMARLTA